MSKKKRKAVGYCAICSQYGPLSFEHVPNREAYNKETTVEYSVQDVLVRKQKARGRIIQGGIGEYTLCEKCNNDTGHWYGAEYAKWARTCFDFLRNRPPQATEPDEAMIVLHDVYPLRFLKQIAVFFFSVAPGLARMQPSLVKFVLEKENTSLPKGSRFFLNFYFGTKPKLRRWPIAAKLSVVYGAGKITPLGHSVISEITHQPFALVMSDETGFAGAGEITAFSGLGYDQKVARQTLKLRVIKGDSALPGSFQ